MSMEIWALVSDEEKRQLEAIAATKQLRTGTALREAIQEYLDHLQQANRSRILGVGSGSGSLGSLGLPEFNPGGSPGGLLYGSISSRATSRPSCFHLKI